MKGKVTKLSQNVLNVAQFIDNTVIPSSQIYLIIHIWPITIFARSCHWPVVVNKRNERWLVHGRWIEIFCRKKHGTSVWEQFSARSIFSKQWWMEFILKNTPYKKNILKKPILILSRHHIHMVFFNLDCGFRLETSDLYQLLRLKVVNFLKIN